MAKFSEDNEEKIKNALSNYGIPRNLFGFYYLCDAINIILEKDSIANVNIEALYEVLSIKYDKDVSSIKLSIKHAINSTVSINSKHSPSFEEFIHDFLRFYHNIY